MDTRKREAAMVKAGPAPDFGTSCYALPARNIAYGRHANPPYLPLNDDQNLSPSFLKSSPFDTLLFRGGYRLLSYCVLFKGPAPKEAMGKLKSKFLDNRSVRGDGTIGYTDPESTRHVTRHGYAPRKRQNKYMPGRLFTMAGRRNAFALASVV